ncbi:hypothetical protein [Haliangium sp.]|uniref:hypothetical protein n=1 Tax=Haliangium sp. TaxID=2663208 RepID=UPI003D14DF1E
MELPLYCVLGELPVKVVATPDDGMEALVYRRETGGFERSLDYLDVILDGTAPELHYLSADEFEQYLAQTP